MAGVCHLPRSIHTMCSSLYLSYDDILGHAEPSSQGNCHVTCWATLSLAPRPITMSGSLSAVNTTAPLKRVSGAASRHMVTMQEQPMVTDKALRDQQECGYTVPSRSRNGRLI